MSGHDIEASILAPSMTSNTGPYGEFREEPIWVTKNLKPIRPNDWCSMDWEGRGGHCCNICWLQPAYAADPLSEKLVRWAYRLICFLGCPCCTIPKFYAFSLGQRCSIVNHCCLYMCCPFCVETALRHNVRRQLNIGDTTTGAGWVGDALLVLYGFAGCYCLPAICINGQLQRAVPDEAWDWPYSIDEVTCFQTPCRFAN